MKNKARSVFSAWVLLVVFLTTMTLSVTHHHEGVANMAADCVECAHHLHHSGHISMDDGGTHDCVLCQFFSLTYTAAITTAVALVCTSVVAVVWHHQLTALLAAGGSFQGRAPPFML